jgi:hypothetical protein
VTLRGCRRRAAAAVLAALLVAPAAVRATPFADVPANHWAYQAIETLAADGLVDGYPDGAFKGDRPLSRYEMAAIVARVVAKLEAEGARTASKADLDTLQKLMNALKDELDALGVRVTALEDQVAALDARTKFAQSLSVHGSLSGSATSRQRLINPQAIDGSGIDNFVNAFETSAASNNPIDQQNGPQTQLQTDDRVTIAYAIDPNLTVSIPVHVANYDLNGEFTPTSQVTVQPDLIVHIARTGAITNLNLREGRLDNLWSSLTGLTYRAPDPLAANPDGYATQPYARGFAIDGTIGGTTDVQLSFAQDDQTLIDTQPYVATPGGTFPNNGYLTYVQAPQTGYAQFGPPGSTSGSLTNDTFAGGMTPLTSVYLRRKAVAGTVYVSGLATGAGAVTFNNAGAIVSGAIPGVSAAPAFAYLDQTNEVVFLAPLPAGATVTITYVGLGYANQQYERYEAGLRVVHHITGVPGASIGFTAHRLWDETGPVTTSDYANDYAGLTPSLPGDAYGPVTDTVFGLDVQTPIAYVRGGAAKAPTLFAEVATSRYTPNVLTVAPVDDAGGIAGLRFTLGAIKGTAEYQSIGANYLDGAPFRYFGNAPPTWADYQGAAFPQFFGFANTLGINQTFDASINQTNPGRSATAANPALTFLYPVFNPFVASGPDFFSAFAPNTQGATIALGGPVQIAGLAFVAHLRAQHLTEVQPDAAAMSTFGPQFASAVRATWDQIVAGGSVNLPFFGRHATLDVSGTFEHLGRNDRTGQAYVPYDPASAGYDPGALANFIAAGGRVNAAGQITGTGSSSVVYYPNYANLSHAVVSAGIAWPVARDLSLTTRISDQRYYGAYGTTLSNNIGGTKDQLDLDLTYTVPNTTSTVGLGYRVSSYKDVVLPSYNFVQSQENVNFSFHF